MSLAERVTPDVVPISERRKKKLSPLARWALIAGVITATSGALGAVSPFINWPFETKEDAKQAHAQLAEANEKIRADIESMKTTLVQELIKTLPKAVADELRATKKGK